MSSSQTLRFAIREQRDLRKSVNGTSEGDAINFYSAIIRSILLLLQTSTDNVKRFPGWKDLLALYYTFQSVEFLQLLF